MASYNPKSSYFCEYRLHAKFQLARLCRSCVFEKVPLSLSDRHKSKCNSSLGLSWESNEARLGWQVGARLTEKNEKQTPKKPYFEAACCLKNVSKSANSWPAVDLLALIGVWMGYDHSERLMLQMLQFNGYNVEKGQWTTAILHNTMTGTSLATRPHTTSPLYYLGI